MNDKNVEKLWNELEDITFIEGEDKELYLGSKWLHFEEGTHREDVWHWFDEEHSKGVAWLMHEYEA